MRILHVSQRYHPARGGAEVHLAALSSRLAAAGHHVTVVTTNLRSFEGFWEPGREIVPEAEAVVDGVRVLRFPVRHLPLAPRSYHAVRRLLWLASRLPVPARAMARLARLTPWIPELWRWLGRTREPFDIVAGMALPYETLLWAALHFARRRQIPFVLYPLTHLGAGPRPGADALSQFYTLRHQVAVVRASDRVIAQTTAERDFYVSRGVSAARITVVGSGVDPEEVVGGCAERALVRHRLRRPLLFSLGTMSHDKGTVDLVETVRRLWDEGRSVSLALAGPLTTAFERYLAALPEVERRRLCLLGPIDDDEKRDLLAACDLFVMPSRVDSFGIVYLEAWLYGKAVIGANAWGVNSVIDDGEDGLLVPFGDRRALAEAITALLDDPQRAAKMGMRGKQKVYRSHTWQQKYEQVAAIYQRLVA
ncbi:MAG: glycosyltransferase family 4 protein [Candidatus Promineifilaceae bacterium]|nr:glycosyltransferase family 4 protein [Candidatus Promineifilaceae bacterium]